MSSELTLAQRVRVLWKREGVKDLVLDNLIWGILILCVSVFCLFIPGYLNKTILINIIFHSAFIGILAIGETLCLLTGNFDLSIESTLAFTAMLAATLMGTKPPSTGWGISPLIVLPLMFAVGALVGVFNGVCITKLKINPFIVTLASMVVLRGGSILLTKRGQAVIRLPYIYKAVALIKIGDFPLIAVISIVLYAIFHFICSRTLFGRKLYAVGGNREASFAFGLNPDRVVILAFMLSGFLAAVAGWLDSARIDAATSGMAEGWLFETMAAAVIGGISLAGGRGSLVGALGGVLLLGSINSALNVAGVHPYWRRVIRGAMIFVAVGIDSLKVRFR